MLTIGNDCNCGSDRVGRAAGVPPGSVYERVSRLLAAADFAAVVAIADPELRGNRAPFQ
jgi:hypothetical protein